MRLVCRARAYALLQAAIEVEDDSDDEGFDLKVKQRVDLHASK